MNTVNGDKQSDTGLRTVAGGVNEGRHAVLAQALLSACHRVQEEYEAEIAARYGDCGDGDEPEGDFHAIMANNLTAWFATPLAELDGISPNDYIRSLDDTAELLELFAVLSGTGVEPMPDLLKIRLGRDHVAATAGLRSFVIKAIKERDVLPDEGFAVAHSALEILAEWEDEDFAPELLAAFESITAPDFEDFALSQSIAQFFGRFPGLAPLLIERIEARLAAGEILTGAADYILVALSLIGAGTGDSAIYRVFTRAIEQMRLPEMVMLMLVDLGNPRAVSFLRAYLQRNLQTLSLAQYRQCVSSISALHGRYDDLPRYPNR